ncbi:E3 ubiquitin-protein ligase BRE1-like 1, partial [Sesamum angolense]
MGSTGEADKKRRHFSSISPTAGAAKKQPLAPLSEEKKSLTPFLPLVGMVGSGSSLGLQPGFQPCLQPLAARAVAQLMLFFLSVRIALVLKTMGMFWYLAVLQFQNQKLIQKLETQKVEINALEDRLCHLKDKQQSYEKTLAVVNSSWEELVDDLESRSNCTLDSLKHGRGFGHHLVKDGQIHIYVSSAWTISDEQSHVLQNNDSIDAKIIDNEPLDGPHQ